MKRGDDLEVLIRKYTEESHGIALFVEMEECRRVIDLLKRAKYISKKVESDYITLSKEDANLDIRISSYEENNEMKKVYLLVYTSSCEKVETFSNLLKKIGIKRVLPNPVAVMESGGWVHSDAYGNSMIHLGKVLVDKLTWAVGKERNNKEYSYLRNITTEELVHEIIIDKFDKNFNEFYGNIKRLTNLMKVACKNFMINKSISLRNDIRRVSLSDTVSENRTYAEIIPDNNFKEVDIINKVHRDNISKTLSKLQKEVVLLLEKSYTFSEIHRKTGLSELQIRTLFKKAE